MQSSNELETASVETTQPEELVSPSLERLLSQVQEPEASSPSTAPADAAPLPTADAAAAVSAPPPVGIRSARLQSVAQVDQRRVAEICFRGEGTVQLAAIAEEVETAMLEWARKERQLVLVECYGAVPVIIGVLQTRFPSEVVVKGRTVHIEAQEELLLRSGSAAVQLRHDGDVQLVGSRILALSRGLFRLVGRMLRLN